MPRNHATAGPPVQRSRPRQARDTAVAALARVSRYLRELRVEAEGRRIMSEGTRDVIVFQCQRMTSCLDEIRQDLEERNTAQ